MKSFALFCALLVLGMIVQVAARPAVDQALIDQVNSANAGVSYKHKKKKIQRQQFSFFSLQFIFLFPAHSLSVACWKEPVLRKGYQRSPGAPRSPPRFLEKVPPLQLRRSFQAIWSCSNFLRRECKKKKNKQQG